MGADIKKILGMVSDQISIDNREKILRGFLVNVVLAVSRSLAAEMLIGNSGNRPINENFVDRLRREILAGNWHLIHQGVAFSPDGLLLDGQHRLLAIYRSGELTSIFVCFNTQQASQAAMDQGMKRTVRDVLRIRGHAWVDNREAAVLRYFIYGPNTNPTEKFYVDEFEEMAEVFKDSIIFATKATDGGSMRGTRKSCVLAPCARAHYAGNNPTRIREFLTVLHTGIMSGPEDTAAILMRNHLIGMLDPRRKESDRVTYYKTSYCLLKFLERQPIRAILYKEKERFPVKPGEVSPADDNESADNVEPEAIAG